MTRSCSLSTRPPGQVSAAVLDDFPSFESPADADADNVYELVVQVSDNKDINGDPDPTVDDTVVVRVTVTDEAEPANVALSYPDPWAGVTLIAGLADDDYSDDASVPDTTWTWERSANGTSDWETAPGTVTDGANLTSAYMPTDDDIGWYLRATANDANLTALPPDSPLDDSLTATTTAAVTAAPECTTPADILATNPADPDDPNSVATPGALGGIGPHGLWSDGRTLWVSAAHTSVGGNARRLTAFGLCDGARDTSQPQQYATVAGTNLYVLGLWAEGSTIWTASGVSPLRAFTMTPQRGWVRDPQNDYELSSEDPPGHHVSGYGMWSDGETIWITDSVAKVRGDTEVHVFAYDWANRPAPGAPDRSLALLVDQDFELRHVIGRPTAAQPGGVFSDGQFIWLIRSSRSTRDSTAVAFSLHEGGDDPVRVPAKNIELPIAPGFVLSTESWSDGKYLWQAAIYEGNDGQEPLNEGTGVFVVRIPNAGPTFPDLDEDGTADPVGLSVAEDAAADGTVLVTLAAVDLEEDMLTYSLDAGTDAAELAAFNAAFLLDPDSGEITVKAGAELDFETRPSYTVTVAVTDSLDGVGDPDPAAAADDTVVVTVTVTNVDDPGTVTLSGSTQVDLEVTATLADPDGAATSVTWKWQVLPAAAAADAAAAAAATGWSDIAGATSASYTPVAADVNEGDWLRAVASYDDAEFGSGKTARSVPSEIIVQQVAIRVDPSPPLVGSPVTAVLTDTAEVNTTTNPIGAVTPSAWRWQVLDATDMPAAVAATDADWATITSATTNAYTPAAADLGRFLRVTATYNSDAVHLITPMVTNLLVSNLGQTRSSTHTASVGLDGVDRFRSAVGFTTGDAEHGYVLTGVDAYTSAVADDSPRVSIFSADGDRPGRRLYVLNNSTFPATGDINALDSFTAAAEVRLSPRTAYYVVFEESSDPAASRGYTIAVTVADVEDDGKASRWSIANVNRTDTVGASDSWTGTFLRVSVIGVKGRLLAAEPAGSAPQAPVALALSEPTYNSLKVSWVQPPGAVAEGYDVQHRKFVLNQGDSVGWTDGGYKDNVVTEFTVTDLQDYDTAYEVRVRATHADGDSAWSATATGSTNRRKPGDDIVLYAANADPRGMWSDGTTLWVANGITNTPLYRYRLDRGPLTTAMQTFAIPGIAPDTGSRGVWSDGSTVWVVPAGSATLLGSNSNCLLGDECVLAYSVGGGRLGQSDIPLPTGTDVTGLWSDGEILWIATGDGKAIAFDLATRTTLSDHDIAFVGESGAATAHLDVWSDGVRMWVATETANPHASFVRVHRLDRTSRADDDSAAFDLVVDRSQTSRARGVWSDRETLWVASSHFTQTTGGVTTRVLRAYVAAGAVANSPAFFGAARFVDTLAVEVADDTAAYMLDLRARDLEGDDLTFVLSGADAALFDIDADGVITPKADLDYESPADTGADNVYELTATVTDSENADGGSDSAIDDTVNVTITVTPVPAAPEAPTDLLFSAQTYNSFEVSWTQAPANPDVTGYTVQWRPSVFLDQNGDPQAQGDNDNWVTTGVTHTGTETVATISGLRDYDTDYQVRVAATNSFEGSSTSAWSVVDEDATGTTNRRKPGGDIVLAVENAGPRGMWSDGTTLWVTDSNDSVLYRYNLDDDGAPLDTFDVAAATAGSLGVWSDGDTVWVVPEGVADLAGSNSNCTRSDECVLAYGVGGGRQGSSDLPLPSGTVAQGLWSDGEILWIATGVGTAISSEALAFDLTTRTALSDLDIDFVDEGARIQGHADVWSDGERMWNSVSTSLPPASRLRVYPLDGDPREDNDSALDLVVDPSQSGRASGVWSDRETLWVSSFHFTQTTGGVTTSVLRAYVAHGAVANSPAFFGAARFVDTLAVSVDENTDENTTLYTLDLRPGDVEGDTLALQRSGDDSGLFELSTEGVITPAPGVTFDYESPLDTGADAGDNVYELTVTVTDSRDAAGAAHTDSTDTEDDPFIDATVNVSITVVNVDEAGEVTLSRDPPRANITVEASLSDPDGDASPLTWQWQLLDADDAAAAAAASDADWATITPAGTGAATDTYTPTDAEVDKWLRAVASYTDPHGPAKTAASVPSLVAVSGTSIEIDPPQPRVASPVTATLIDTDAISESNTTGDVTTSATWKWEATVGLTASDSDTNLATTWVDATGDGAATNAYTPTAADLHQLLRVTAVYNADTLVRVTPAVTDLLVSNLAQSRSGLQPGRPNDGAVGAFIDARWAHRFTTGDAQHGYVISSVDAYTDAADDDEPRVSIFSDASGAPARRLFVLTNPGFEPTGDASVLDSFTGGDHVRLAPSTSYHIVFEDVSETGQGYRLALTGSHAEDATSASGWGLADVSQRDLSAFLAAAGDWIDTGTLVPLLGVRGQVRQPDPAGTAPQKPVGVVFPEATFDSLNVSWLQPLGAAPTGYTVQWRPIVASQGDDDNWVSTGVSHTGTDTEATITGLDDYDTRYEVRVKATHTSADDSGWSDVATGSTNRRKPAADIDLHADNDNPSAMWSDGTTLWVADSARAVLYRYNFDGTAVTNFRTPEATGGNLGVWSDGSTVWVSPDDEITQSMLAGSNCPNARKCLLAYNVADGQRAGDRDIETAAGVLLREGLWSDGEIMWVATEGDGIREFDKVLAFDLATGAARSDLDIAYHIEDADSARRGDVWSDGVRMWIATTTALPSGLYVRVHPLDGGPRTSAESVRDLVLDPSDPARATGVWSDRDTLWVSSAQFLNDDGTNSVLRAYVAHGSVANSPPFFGAARFEDSLEVSVDENTDDNTALYTLDLRPGDAEGDTLTLGDLAGADADLFELSAEGVLTQKADTTLNFEMPADTGTDAGDNVYELSVTVNDGTTDHTLAITITVNNLDEPGRGVITNKVALTGEHSSVILVDPDGAISNSIWQWQVLEGSLAADADAAAEAGGWSQGSGTGTFQVYTPADDEAGMWLRAVVTYTDAQGPGKMAVSNVHRIYGPVSAPTNVAVSEETYNSFKVRWTEPTATPAVMGYAVQWRKDEPDPGDWNDFTNFVDNIQEPITDTAVTIRDLPEFDTDYEVRVLGGNGGGLANSEWSAPVDVSTNRRKPDDDITLTGLVSMDHLTGLWSDGADDGEIWVSVSTTGSQLYYYDRSDLSAAPTEFATPGSTDGNLGVWSDGETVWTMPEGTAVLTGPNSGIGDGDEQSDCYSGLTCLLAYDIASGERRGGRDIALTNKGHGLWSDGAIMWVTREMGTSNTDPVGPVHAYDLVTGERVAALDIDVTGLPGPDFTRRWGLWSDGVNLWVGSTGRIPRAYEVEVYPLDGSTRDAAQALDLDPDLGRQPESAAVRGLWSDRTTLWRTDGSSTLRAYVAKGAVANSPAFFGAARFVDTLAVEAPEFAEGYTLDMRPGDVEGNPLTLGALAGNDAALFTFSDGVITQKSSTVFDPDSPADHNTDNVYELTVTVTDGMDVADAADSDIDHTVNVTITILPTPDAPTTLVFSEQTFDSLKVSWTQAESTPEVTGYNVQWRTVDTAQGADENWSTVGVSHTGTATVAVIEGLPDYDTPYEVRVQATNRVGPGPWSMVDDDATGTTNRRKPDDDIVLHADNDSPRGMWSDGTTLWVSDSATGSPLYRYRLDGSPLATQMQTFALPGFSAIGSHGVWSDGRTVWVAPLGTPALSGSNSNCTRGDECILAFDVGPGGRLGPSDIALPSGTVPYGLWSDGEILWVATFEGKALAFDLATRTALSDLDIAFVDEGALIQAHPDVWSDGVRMWVGTHTRSPTASRVRVYRLDRTSRADDSSAALDLVVDPSQASRALGVWSDRETLWVSSFYFTQTTGGVTTSVLRAYVAAGTVANSPAFFGAARFVDTLAIEVAENGAGYRLDMRPGDVEGDDLTVVLEGDDAALFTLSDDGVITLKADTFNFELPADTGTADNVYELTVKVSDRNDADGNNDDDTNDNTPTFDQTVAVTVTVTDVDEPGSLTFGAPRPETAVSALLADPDLVSATNDEGIPAPADVSWQWQVLPAADAADAAAAAAASGWSDATGTGATAVTYTPVAGDTTKWLRVVATYTDGGTHGSKTLTSAPRQILSVPDAPDELVFPFSDQTYNSFKVTWTQATAVPAVTSFEVQWRLADQMPEAAWITRTISDPAVRELAISALTVPDTDYDVQVRAHNSEGPSDWAEAVGATNRYTPHLNIELAPANDNPRGMWSDGTTVWVSDLIDAVLYRYRFDGTALDTIDISAEAPGGSYGVWSDGTTLWVLPDSDVSSLDGTGSNCTNVTGCVLAYDMDGVRQPGKEIPTHTSRTFVGLWSDGEIMWLSTDTDEVEAFDLATGAALSDRDIMVVLEEGNTPTSLFGVWSDGVRMWVATGVSLTGSYVRVYPLNGGARPDEDKALNLVVDPSTGVSARGIWSDRETLWVSSRAFSNADDTTSELRAFLATGAVDNSPAFFGAARFVESLAVDVAENTAAGYRLDMRPGDAENDPLTLGALEGADAALFTLDSDGVITPKASTTFDFEVPSDTGTDAADNVYELTVKVSDRHDADGNNDDDTNDSTPTFDQTVTVTITVTDVDEPGSVTFDPPRPEAAVTATLTDPDAATSTNTDGSVTPTSWLWQVLTAADLATAQAASDADWATDTPAGTGATTQIYTPHADEASKWLRVRAVYDDTHTTGITLTSAPRQILSVPAAPREFVFSKRTFDSFKVAWTQDPSTPAVDDVEVQWRTHVDSQADDANWKTTGIDHTGLDTEATFSRLPSPDTAYDVRARASNREGPGEWAVAMGATNRYTPDDNIELHEDNTDPLGMWSDGSTLWVSDHDQSNLYGYNLDNRAAAVTVFPLVHGAGRGVWSDGSTLWVAPTSVLSQTHADSRCHREEDRCVVAYKLSTRQRQLNRDILTPTGLTFSNMRGLWSDGEILWVATDGGKAVAFDLDSGEARSDLDITYATETADSDAQFDVWSDGVRMWVGTRTDTPYGSYVRVHPLDGSTTRDTTDEALDLVVGSTNGPATGVWSDRETLWVSSLHFDNADETRKELRAFLATGTVANSPAFFGAARFEDALAVEVAENTVGYRLDMRPGDVENDGLTVTLEGADAGLFRVSSDGVITPTAAALDFELPDDDGDDRVYELTAIVTDSMNADGGPDPDADQTVNITITVTDVSEDGRVSLSRAPMPNVEVAAVLTDPDVAASGNTDGSVTTATWLWQVAATSGAADADWSTGSGTGNATVAYTPTDVEAGMWLRVTATYNDTHGSQTLVSTPRQIRSTPAAPTALVFSEHTFDSFKVSWTQAQTTPAVDRVEVRWRKSVPGQGPETGEAGWTPVLTLDRTAREYRFEGLADYDTDYDVQVRAHNSEGDGEWAAAVGFTNRYTPAADIVLADGNDLPTGIFYDGTTLWVADGPSSDLYRYSLDGTPMEVPTLATLRGASPGNFDVWSDGDTVWVLPRSAVTLTDSDGSRCGTSGDECVLAYDAATGQRRARKDVGLDAGGLTPFTVWSDGEVMWVTTQGDSTHTARAFDLASGEPLTSRNIDLSGPTGSNADSTTVVGLWSDGVSMWAAYNQTASSSAPDASYVRSFPLDGTARADGEQAPDFHIDPSARHAGWLWSDRATLWVSNDLITTTVDGDTRKVLQAHIADGAVANSPAFFGQARFQQSLAIEVPENTADYRLDLRPNDVEGDPLTLGRLEGADASLFQLSSDGVITLRAATFDFEIPTDADSDNDNNPENTYELSVTVTDRKTADGAPDTRPSTITDTITITDTNIDQTVAITITVLDVDEPAKVSLNRNPRPGRSVTASLKHPDRADADNPTGSFDPESWSWQVLAFNATSAATAADAQNAGGWTNGDGTGQATATYTPSADEAGSWLRATATYDDDSGSNPARPVRSSPAPIPGTGVNFAPAFPDADLDGTADPIQQTVPQNRARAATTPAATAFDPDDTRLHYKLSGPDSEHFEVVATTGQIRSLTALDPEAPIDANGNNQYELVLEVSDRRDDTGEPDPEDAPRTDDTVQVTVTVTEPPPTRRGPIRRGPGRVGGPATPDEVQTGTPGECPSQGASHPFTDVSPSSFADDAVACLYELRVTTGRSEELYDPTAPVTRAQMAVFLSRLYTAVTGETPPIADHTFTDVEDSSARDQIAQIFGLGITTGRSDEVFDPDAPVTRDEMAVFLSRLYTAITDETPPIVDHPFTDIEDSSARDQIAQIFGLGITTGRSEELYDPDAPVTRDEMAVFLSRLFTAIATATPETEAPETPMHPFTDIEDSSARDHIAHIFALGITSGRTPTTYDPTARVTRAHMAVFLSRLYTAITGKVLPVADHTFTDIQGSSALDHIARLFGLGIANGLSDDTYDPTARVTRAHMAVFLTRLYTAITGETPPVVDHPFTDIEDSSAQDHIAQIFGLGLTTASSDQLYNPNTPVTRAQMAVFLSRLHTLLTPQP